jgi:ABC-type Fe3+/spermidine/putrescine transport system ATPase subunit
MKQTYNQQLEPLAAEPLDSITELQDSIPSHRTYHTAQDIACIRGMVFTNHIVSLLEEPFHCPQYELRSTLISSLQAVKKNSQIQLVSKPPLYARQTC